MSEVHNTKSENWCLKSTIGSQMYEVWRNLKFDVRKLSELCLKSEVQSMSKIRVWNQSLKSVSCMLSKSETEVQSLKPNIWKSEVCSKFFAIIITLSYNTSIIYCVFVD